MFLSDGEIKKAIDEGELGIQPPDGYDVLIKSASVDLRLAPTIQVIRADRVDPAEIIDATSLIDVSQKIEAISEKREIYPDQPFVIEHGQLVIASTAERIVLPDNMTALVEGKSSLARFGVQVHFTAPKIDPGWKNHITLEIMNSGSSKIALKPMMEIAALMVARLGSPSLRAYDGRF